MATKRMFDKAIIDTDRFMDLSMSMKGTYVVFGMEADDEGFVSYKKVVRIHGVNEDDIKVLIAKGFFISFESGVVVITDWNKNNWLDKRRIKPTEYQKEKALLNICEDRTYVLSRCLAPAKPEESSIEESSIEESSSTRTKKRFTKPTVEEIKAYCDERKNKVSPQRFFDYYESKGWVVGKSPMKDWKAAVRTWEKNGFDSGKNQLKAEVGKYDKFS